MKIFVSVFSAALIGWLGAQGVEMMAPVQAYTIGLLLGAVCVALGWVGASS